MNTQRTPVDLAAWIEEQKVQARLVDEIGDTPTVPAAAEALGVVPDRIVKTLLFLVNDPAVPDEPPQPVVVIGNGERRIDKRPIADHFGVGKKQVKLASPAVVLRKLGYPAGGVPPFGHLHAHPVLLDSAIADFDAAVVVYAGGGDERTMLELSVAELVRVVAPRAILPLSQT